MPAHLSYLLIPDHCSAPICLIAEPVPPLRPLRLLRPRASSSDRDVLLLLPASLSESPPPGVSLSKPEGKLVLRPGEVQGVQAGVRTAIKATEPTAGTVCVSLPGTPASGAHSGAILRRSEACRGTGVVWNNNLENLENFPLEKHTFRGFHMRKHKIWT